MNDFPDNTPYIGLDWFVLDLLGSSLIFIFIEKLFALRHDQPVFRPEWQTDLHHFIVNHMVVGFVLLATNLLVHKLFGWAAHDGIRGWVAEPHFFVALFLIVLVADLVQYWTHRAYHEVPLLWRLHAVHHSVKSMDWLAGSRQHIIELLITRTLVLAPIYVLGFSKEVIDAYIVIVGFQAVFNHANVSVRLGPLRYVIVTPNFHHWHHSQDKEALDRNYAAHFAFLDYLFGTAVKRTASGPKLRRARRLRAERLPQAARFSVHLEGLTRRGHRLRACGRARRPRRLPLGPRSRYIEPPTPQSAPRLRLQSSALAPGNGGELIAPSALAAGDILLSWVGTLQSLGIQLRPSRRSAMLSCTWAKTGSSKRSATASRSEASTPCSAASRWWSRSAIRSSRRRRPRRFAAGRWRRSAPATTPSAWC